MAAAVDRYLEQLGTDDAADRRNGYYRRHLLTELGESSSTFRGPAATAQSRSSAPMRDARGRSIG